MGEAQRFGEFGYHALTGGFVRDMSQLHPERLPLGLSVPTQWIYGFLSDREDRLYIPIRKFTAALSGGLFLNAEIDGSLATHPASGKTSRGELRRTFADDHVCWDQPMWHRMPKGTISDEERPVYLKLHNEYVEYSEGDLLNLSGASAGLGAQYYVSAPDAPVFFTSLCFWVEGEILGNPVEGPVFFDSVYGRFGQEWKEYVYFTDLELAWHVFANKFEDGTVEWGHQVAGRRGFGPSVVISGDRTLHAGGDFSADYELDPSGYTTRMRYDLDGEEYAFVGERIGWLEEFSASRTRDEPFRAQMGRALRTGEDRPVHKAVSWLESFPNRITADGLDRVAALS